MSAETLRKAAALMRERAEGATSGPWWLRSDGVLVSPAYIVADYNAASGADLNHIASWHPAVALAVADWLDDEAGKSEWFKRGKPVYPESPLALTVALAYLGETS